VSEGTATEVEVIESGGVIKVGDLVIDESTGEVLDWPAGTGNRVEYLTKLCVEAQQAIKAWEAALNGYKHALGKLLDDEAVTSLKTGYGTPAWRTQNRTTGRPERVADVARAHELAPAQVDEIWRCATALDAKRLIALADAGAIPPSVAADLIDTKTSRFLVVTAARPPAPVVERVTGKLPQ
jgi:hypothetical protein